VSANAAVPRSSPASHPGLRDHVILAGGEGPPIRWPALATDGGVSSAVAVRSLPPKSRARGGGRQRRDRLPHATRWCCIGIAPVLHRVAPAPLTASAGHCVNTAGRGFTLSLSGKSTLSQLDRHVFDARRGQTAEVGWARAHDTRRGFRYMAAPTHEDAVLMIQLSQWGTAMGFQEAIRSLLADD
jgi:hypothetical protein